MEKSGNYLCKKTQGWVKKDGSNFFVKSGEQYEACWLEHYQMWDVDSNDNSPIGKGWSLHIYLDDKTFKKHFLSANEIRKQKLEKLKLYNS